MTEGRHRNDWRNLNAQFATIVKAEKAKEKEKAVLGYIH